MKKRCAKGHTFDYKETKCPICFKDRDKYRDRDHSVYDNHWKKFRKNLSCDILYSFCWICFLEKNKFVYKTHLHHIIPLSKWPEGKYVEKNLACLCGGCHNTVESNPDDYDFKRIRKNVKEKLEEIGRG